MTPEPLLAMEHISKSFYGNQVLEDVSITLNPGEIHALLGENGAGKSTLMNILFGMPVIHSTGGYEGRITFRGSHRAFRSPREAMDAGVAMVHQEFMLISGFTVAENIKLNREPVLPGPLSRVHQSLARLNLKQMYSDAKEDLREIGVSIDEWAPAAGLPVGHKQFVEIAREIDKKDVALLVLDEPTAVLTEGESAVLMNAIKRLRDKGLGILFITHRLSEVLEFADRVTMLRDGKVVGSMKAQETTIDELASLMVGRPFTRSAVLTRPRKEPGIPHLAIRNFGVEMPGERVVGIDLDVNQGEILGIGGLAGQGKIGLANGVMGLYPATGSVTKNGKPVVLNSPKISLDSGFSFLSEDRRGVGLLLDESLELNIAYSLLVHKNLYRRKGLAGRLGSIDWPSVRSLAQKSIADLDIRCTGPAQAVRRLSGGNQQKVCFARALSLNPEIFFVSEPTRGIDIGAKQRVLDLIVQANAERGVTVVVTSSDLSELRQICDRIAVVYGGKVAGILPPDARDVEFGLLMSGKGGVASA